MQIYFIILLMFIILFIYCCNGSKINYEGMNTIDEDNTTNKNERALLLALKNAATLASLNDKIQNLSNLDERFTKIENKVKINFEGIQDLTNQLADFTTTLGNKK